MAKEENPAAAMLAEMRDFKGYLVERERDLLRVALDETTDRLRLIECHLLAAHWRGYVP